MRAIKRLGKSVNVEEVNKLMSKRVPNINLIEERKINETQTDVEKR